MSELEFSQALEKPNEEFEYSCKITPNFDKNAFLPHKIGPEVSLKFKYFVDYDSVLHMNGYLSVPCEFMCDRCMARFNKNLFLDFEESAYPRMSEESEITYNMPRIKLDDVVTAYIITHFPSKVLCREDCKGLCPHCGANLNEGDCNCNKK